MSFQYKLQNPDRFDFFLGGGVVMVYFLYKEELHLHSFLRQFAPINCTGQHSAIP